MRKYVRIVVALVLLTYGLIRLGVGSALFGQVNGWIDFPAFHEPLIDIGNFLAKSTENQIIPFSVAGYVSYIALMGLMLLVGAFRALRNLTHGLSFIATFIVMYSLLFFNFQTINPKIIHLGVCIILFGVLLGLKNIDISSKKDLELG